MALLTSARYFGMGPGAPSTGVRFKCRPGCGAPGRCALKVVTALPLRQVLCEHVQQPDQCQRFMLLDPDAAVLLKMQDDRGGELRDALVGTTAPRAPSGSAVAALQARSLSCSGMAAG